MGQRQRSSEPYFRQVDFVFYNEARIRLAVKEMHMDDGRIRLPQAQGFSDPTAAAVLRNLAPIKKIMVNGEQTLEQPERWLTVLDKTWMWARAQGDCRFEVARRRYAR